MIRLLSAIAAALLGAATLADEPAPPRPDVPIYRLDRYTARPGKLDGLHAWFRAHTDDVLGKSSAEAVAFLVPATPTAARESFAAFRGDPDWLAAKKASEDKAGGSLTSPENGVVSEFFVATDYSPLR